jgi:peptidylprolyl isomerase
MSLRVAVLSILLAACGKAEPTKSEAKPSLSARPAKPSITEHAPTARGARPSLPAIPSDFNPPGIPQLSGEVHEGERGLQYIDETVGTGRAPEKGKPVTVHYTGWLTDGTKFDSSRDRNEPIVIPFDTGAVIKGWDLGLETMRVGGKRRLLIPAAIAYGDHGAGDVIPPDSVLVFDVELIDVDSK